MKTRELKTLIAVFKTYVRPLLEYASEIWNPTLKKDIDRIERVQKFFTRKVFRKCGLIHKSYKERLEICKLKELTERRKIADLTTTFKIIKGFTSLNAGKMFIFADRSLRRPLLLREKRYKVKSKNNFFHRIVKEWNKLPVLAMEINKPNEFRGLLNAMV